MNPETALLRLEQLIQSLRKNKEFLMRVLCSDRVEITVSIKGTSIKIKAIEYADDD